MGKKVSKKIDGGTGEGGDISVFPAAGEVPFPHVVFVARPFPHRQGQPGVCEIWRISQNLRPFIT